MRDIHDLPYVKHFQGRSVLDPDEIAGAISYFIDRFISILLSILVKLSLVFNNFLFIKKELVMIIILCLIK